MHRRGLTLTELLVLIALVVCLVALIIWAIHLRRATLPQVKSIELTLLDDFGSSLTELQTNQGFDGQVNYSLLEESAPVDRVTLRLGMYVDGDFVTAGSKTTEPELDSSGTWIVHAPLRAAPRAGTYHIRCEMRTESGEWHVVMQREIRIEEPED